MVTADNLSQILMALKDAGLEYARLGDCEFKFPVEVVAAPVQEQTIVIDRLPAQTVPDVRQPVEQRPGYARLFGDHAPRFKGNE